MQRQPDAPRRRDARAGEGMAPREERLHVARHVAGDPRQARHRGEADVRRDASSDARGSDASDSARRREERTRVRRSVIRDAGLHGYEERPALPAAPRGRRGRRARGDEGTDHTIG
ncbi:hypothetical protein [Agromyces mangrovi Wang et al. 2018]|uniref:hypothetical protein n=1 Tax=Agromyces mangrovi TaxID=1858653 RepID=UPI0025740A09|nr:hypothetical protein [Agromyces mangrovi]